jgi:ATP-dependent RNA helicase DeaD
MQFDDLDIDERLKRKARELGFSKPTEIQERAMPEIISGRDVVGQAETGSGKTVAFAVPILSRVRQGQGMQCLVLTPTRELCIQVAGVFKDFGSAVGIHADSVYGGVGMEPQYRSLKTCEVIVGTPGRILDHTRRGTIDYSRVKFMVLDEADRMFDMGFIEDVEDIIARTPRKRQTLMFSATISSTIQDIMERHMDGPKMIWTRSHVDARKLAQVYYDIFEQNDKFSVLVHLLKNREPGLAIVFCATRHESDLVSRNLMANGVNAMAIHGGMTQAKREISLDSLRDEKIDVLVATDVAARGLDIKNVTQIYNYDVPKTSIEYVHRIGRTARAGESGMAVTLLTQRDHDNFRRVLRDGELSIEKEELPDYQRVPFRRFSDSDGHREGYRGRSSYGGGYQRGGHRDRGSGYGRGPRGGYRRESSRDSGYHREGGYRGRQAPRHHSP